MGSVCSNGKVIASVDVDDDEKVGGEKSPTAPGATTSLPDATPNDDSGEFEGTIRLLLLGASESGKTTLLQQIRVLFKQTFNESEMIHRKAFIYNNVVISMGKIVQYARQHNFALKPENDAKADLILNVNDCLGPLTREEYDAVVSLWKDDAVKKAYNVRGEYNLNDSAEYFFDNLERINTADYQPTVNDLIRAYVPTCGIQNIVFTTKNRSFQLFDIGGQKVDRRKWATMYDGLDAIFFCIAVSEYDQKCEDEEEENKLFDALSLLEKICQEPKFERTPIFVFLNEIDVLQEKQGAVPLRNVFPDYNGVNEQDALAFLLSKVKDRCRGHANTFFECISAIDTALMEEVLDRSFKQLLAPNKA